ncbi:MAG: trigger factor [Ruminococcaceae bacterium]|nr:trigger factor [Oscillospiraceae bacterium]
MAVKSEQVEKNLVKLTFEISAEAFEEAVQKVYQKNVKKINVPGFRKGKAPRAMIEKYYSEAVFYEDALNMVLPGAYDAALAESGADAVARPEIDVEDIEKGKPVVVTALVTTRPEVKLGTYKGIEIEKIEHTVTDEDVDKALEAEQKKHVRINPVEGRAAQNGDVVTIDFEGFADGIAFPGGKGEGYELELGSGSFIPGFEEQLVGVEAGADTEVNVTFPEEYHAADLAGKPALFKVKVHEIKEKIYPELDDDFASEASEFETLAEMKADIRKKLEEKAENQTKTEMENAIIDKASEAAEIDIPAAMIEAQIDRMLNDFAQRLSYQGMNMEMYMKYTGATEETMRENFRPQAEKQVRVSLVIEAVAKAEGIDANEEEVEAKLLEMAKMYNMEIDELKKYMRPEDTEGVEKEVIFTKAIDLMVNNAIVK